MKNIDSSFRHIRRFTLVVIILCGIISCYSVYKSFQLVGKMKDRIYILSGGQALEAQASYRSDNLDVEARDHVKVFHRLFFTLDPDLKAIKDHVGQALYLADGSAKQVYDELHETGYYGRLIAGNVNQTLQVDSIIVDTDAYPFQFRCYAKQNIIRPTSMTTRSLITQGGLRQVSRSDHNPHGFLIERWETIENKDLETVNRR